MPTKHKKEKGKIIYVYIYNYIFKNVTKIKGMNSLSSAIIEELRLTYNNKLLAQNANFTLFACNINKELDFLEVFTAIYEKQKNNNILKSNKLLKNDRYKSILKKDDNYIEFWRLSAITTQNLLIRIQSILMNYTKIDISRIKSSEYQQESVILIQRIAPIMIKKLKALSEDLNQCAIKLPHFLQAKEHTPLSLFNFHNMIFNKKSTGIPYATLMENPYCSAILKAKSNNTNNTIIIEDALISKLDISYEELEAYHKATKGYETASKFQNQLNQPQQIKQPQQQYYQNEYQYDHNNNNNYYYRRGRGRGGYRRGYGYRGRGGRNYSRTNKNTEQWKAFCKKQNINPGCTDKDGKKICRLFNQEKNCQNNCRFIHVCARCGKKDHPVTKCPALNNND